MALCSADGALRVFETQSSAPFSFLFRSPQPPQPPSPPPRLEVIDARDDSSPGVAPARGLMEVLWWFEQRQEEIRDVIGHARRATHAAAAVIASKLQDPPPEVWGADDWDRL